MELKVKEVIIFTGGRVGPDVINLKLDITEGIWPFENEAVTELKVAARSGEAYVREHFKALGKYKVINVSTGHKTIVLI